MREEFIQGFASTRELNLMRIKEAKDNGLIWRALKYALKLCWRW